MVYQGKLSQRASVNPCSGQNYIKYNACCLSPNLNQKFVDHDHEMSNISVYMKFHIYPDNDNVSFK